MFCESNHNAVVLQGGLGNQLFQYAFALNFTGNVWLEESYFKYDHERSYKLDNYNIKLDTKSLDMNYWYSDKTFLKEVKRRICGYPKYIYKEECYFTYNSELLKKKNTLFEGYWQHLDYAKVLIDRRLELKTNKNIYDNVFYRMVKKEKCAVAIHVRRGDYTSLMKVYNILSEKYYFDAISYFNRFDNPKFFVFSDDIEWCKENLKRDDFIYVECLDDIAEFEIMRHCNHYIIANSTFSWWASRLSYNEAPTIIMPDKWLVNEKNNDRCIRALSDGAVLLRI